MIVETLIHFHLLCMVFFSFTCCEMTKVFYLTTPDVKTRQGHVILTHLTFLIKLGEPESDAA